MQQAITQSGGSQAQPDASGRFAVWIRGASLAAIVAGLFLVMSVLPMQESGQRFESWVTSLGVWGPAAFILVYIVATVLMIPGSALTLAAGAIFGLWVGLAAASVASTTGAAAAFLIGRYLARDKIAKRFGQHPKFTAIDRAVGEGGWKIVAMLRLSPVVPFNVQNYLYGLTAIRFWPAVLASWVAMLPGTFMYVYLGYVGKATAVAATGSNQSTSWGPTTLKVVGLLATIAVTVYVTRLATRAVKEHTTSADDSKALLEQDVISNENKGRPSRGGLGVALIAVIGVLMLSGGAYARMNSSTVRGYVIALIAPAEVMAAETASDDTTADDTQPEPVAEATPDVVPDTVSDPAAEASPDAAVEGETEPAFDHGPFDHLLHEFVDPDGWVDYESLAQDTEALDGYIASIVNAPYEELGKDDQLALLINAYNAFTLRLVLDHYPVGSIRDIPKAERWAAERWQIAGETYSLNQIEHELIRKQFAEPRIHFSLVCAAYSCPPLRNEAYVGERLEAQLHSQAVYTHTHPRWFVYDSGKNTVSLTSLYEWYGGDFKIKADSVLDFAAGYVPELRSALDDGRKPKAGWINYDWKLNSKANRP